MKIKDAAQKYGVSPQAIYKRLNSNGIDVHGLIDPQTKELTADAEAMLAKLYDKPDQPKPEGLKSTIERLQSEVNRLSIENATLVERCENLQAQVTKLENERERLLGLAEGAQEAQRQLLQGLLPAAANAATDGTQGATGGFIDRLRRAFRR